MKSLMAVLVLGALVASACASAPAAEPTTTETFAPMQSTTTSVAETTTVPPTTTTTTEPADTEAPAVVTTPSDGEIVDGYVVAFEATTEPDAVVLINDEPVVIDGDGGFSFTVASDIGENAVTVEATDVAGNTENSVVTYVFAPEDGWIAAIGDSVMLGSKEELEKRIGPGTVDATVSRQFLHAPDLVRSMLAREVPPQVIVVHLGTNGPVQERHFEELMEVAAEVPLMVFVNSHVPTRNWEGETNRQLEAGVERHDNAVLVDWHTPTKGRSDLFAADNFHPKQPGRVIYAELIAEAIFPNWEPLDE